MAPCKSSNTWAEVGSAGFSVEAFLQRLVRCGHAVNQALFFLADSCCGGSGIVLSLRLESRFVVEVLMFKAYGSILKVVLLGLCQALGVGAKCAWGVL